MQYVTTAGASHSDYMAGYWSYIHLWYIVYAVLKIALCDKIMEIFKKQRRDLHTPPSRVQNIIKAFKKSRGIPVCEGRGSKFCQAQRYKATFTNDTCPEALTALDSGAAVLWAES